jgi:hypothetical protein
MWWWLGGGGEGRLKWSWREYKNPKTNSKNLDRRGGLEWMVQLAPAPRLAGLIIAIVIITGNITRVAADSGTVVRELCDT